MPEAGVPHAERRQDVTRAPMSFLTGPAIGQWALVATVTLASALSGGSPSRFSLILVAERVLETIQSL